MRIGVDVDGVLADYTAAYNALVKKELGITLPYPAPSWNWHLAGGVTKSQADQMYDLIKATPFWGTVPALPGAPDNLQRLNTLGRMGNDIYFITVRSGKLAKFWTELWLRLGGMETPTVLIAQPSTSATPERAKGLLVQGLNLDVWIDDKPENNEAVINASPRTRVYLANAPYNQWAVDPFYGIRIANLAALLELEFPKEESRAA